MAGPGNSDGEAGPNLDPPASGFSENLRRVLAMTGITPELPARMRECVTTEMGIAAYRISLAPGREVFRRAIDMVNVELLKAVAESKRNRGLHCAIDITSFEGCEHLDFSSSKPRHFRITSPIHVSQMQELSTTSTQGVIDGLEIIDGEKRVAVARDVPPVWVALAQGLRLVEAVKRGSEFDIELGASIFCVDGGKDCRVVLERSGLTYRPQCGLGTGIYFIGGGQRG